MLTFAERMNNIEALVVRIYNLAQDLATFDEADAVVTQIFDDIEGLEDRITALKNNINMIERILSTA
jgi:hypothetical protein